MANEIGQLIKSIAESRGLSQKEFGEKINLTKQGAASIYKRSTIDTELLILISEKLDFDFFAHFYKYSPLKKFKQLEIKQWESKIDILNDQLKNRNELLESKEEILVLQRKLIAELEEKLKMVPKAAPKKK